MDTSTPKWISDFCRLLPIRSQFILSGNIRDRFLTPTDNGYTLTSLIPSLWSIVQPKGYDFLLVYDQVDGLKVYPDTLEYQKQAAEAITGIRWNNGQMNVKLTQLLEIMTQVVRDPTSRIAIVIDYASRLLSSTATPSEEEKYFLVGSEKLGNIAQPKISPNGISYNPVIWLLNRSQDLPPWFALDCEKIQPIEIASPTLQTREAAASVLVNRFIGAREATDDQRSAAIRTFTESTDDLSLQAMSDISQLAAAQKINITDIDDAIRAFKVGDIQSPWKTSNLRKMIAQAGPRLEDRVKGQKQAIIKSVDILTRSVMGLTGAQARSSGMRPRGVLFFAGPTGVGKTELAKSLTQLLFGDDSHYIRFDMSEFAEEHASARLLGAPPGYVGYDAGGELTNRVRQKPFSVILFDEIEKAHPRLLDKFLQILEDGRLTDGRGDTVYFSESVIIFTSNLGIYITDESGQRVANVSPSDPYETVERRVRLAIEDYFKYQLARPEILNRMGDNIVVFNFIRQEIAREIFDGMLKNVIKRVNDEHGINLVFAPNVCDQIFEWCSADLANGGRGIGNRLETTFINPLARALFQTDLTGHQKIEISSVFLDNDIYSLKLK